jgi:hypothetical protein
MRLHGSQAIGPDLAPLAKQVWFFTPLNCARHALNLKLAAEKQTDHDMPKSLVPITRRLNVGLVTAALMLAGLTGASASYKAPAPVVLGAPLTFGMSPDEASVALGVPLSYVRGSRGNELLLALPNVKGSALTIRSDGLYLQFRRGRLSGWKGDWGTARPPVVGW